MHHSTHLFDIDDSIPQIPQVRKSTVRANFSIDQEPHMRHVGRPTSGVEISVEMRESVAQLYKTLVEDQGHVTSEAPDNQTLLGNEKILRKKRNVPEGIRTMSGGQ